VRRRCQKKKPSNGPTSPMDDDCSQIARQGRTTGPTLLIRPASGLRSDPDLDKTSIPPYAPPLISDIHISLSGGVRKGETGRKQMIAGGPVRAGARSSPVSPQPLIKGTETGRSPATSSASRTLVGIEFSKRDHWCLRCRVVEVPFSFSSKETVGYSPRARRLQHRH